MQLASVCKPHDCADHNTVLRYDAIAGAVYAKVVQAGRSALAAELDKLWQQEWRAGKWLELQEPAR